MPSKVRVMFVGHGPTNLPEDRVINVFHFESTDAYVVAAETCMDQVEGFYTDIQGGITSLGFYLSPWVQRAAELRSYDLGTPPQRVPTVRPITLPASGGQGYVEETALCLTLVGPTPVTRRRRGRIYFGPLNASAVTPATTSQPTRPDVGLVNCLISAATTLANAGATAGWVIRSTRPVENFVPIVGGYVDNAFDNQLRRGPDTTARTQWTALGV